MGRSNKWHPCSFCTDTRKWAEIGWANRFSVRYLTLEPLLEALFKLYPILVKYLCITALNYSCSSDQDCVPLRWHLRQGRTMSLLHVVTQANQAATVNGKSQQTRLLPLKNSCLSRTDPTIWKGGCEIIWLRSFKHTDQIYQLFL